MDPWLEHPARWPNVHQSLITYSRDALQGQVGDRYFVSIGERVYLAVPDQSLYPDVSVVETRTGATVAPQAAEADRPVVVLVDEVEQREVFLEIFDAASGDRIVTIIEVMSPSNKHAGTGRDLYLRTQAEILASTTNLVEIDLLRDGEPTAAVPRQRQSESPYRVVVSRASDRRRRELYPVRLQDRLPRVAIPLLEGDPAAVLDIQAVFDEVYDKSGFGRWIDYGQPPVPPLRAEDTAWARELLAAAG
jgi:hypothetical protein